MSETEALVQAVQQAALAASEAAKALRDAGISKHSGFAEANRTVQCPKEFGSAISADDATAWPDFSFAFKQWLCFADENYLADLKHVEDNAEVEISFTDTAVGQASKARSVKLYTILSGVLRNRPLKVLRQVQNNNGFEVWRHLQGLFAPRTRVRAMSILSAIMAYPSFNKEMSMVEQVANLERLSDEYRRAAGKDLSEDVLLTTLVKSLPAQLRQHVQLSMTEGSTFRDVKEKIVAYEKVSTSWSRDRVLQECGATALGSVTSYAPADSGPTPMEVNVLSEGKGKKGKGSVTKAKGNRETTKAKERESLQRKAKGSLRRDNKRATTLGTTTDNSRRARLM